MIAELQAIQPEMRILSGPGAKRAYDCDAYTVDKSKPSVIVFPQSTNDVAAVVNWCTANGVPYTPRGAGTGLSGGAMPALGGVIVSTKHLTQILETDVENRCMLVQAGVANRKISDAVANHGLHFAPDPSSQFVSTIGGNIAENSGGPHTLKYGVTVQHILGLTMVMPTGEIESFGGRVAGHPGVDLLGLVVGSEGTLGIVTEAWVKLTPLPTVLRTALVSFASARDATQAVAAIIAEGVIPAALEIMDKGILAALRVAFNLEYPPGSEALLLVECDGERAEAEMDVVARLCEGALSFRLAQNEDERLQLWTARKKGIGAIGRLAPTIVTHDGVIPRSKLPEMLDHVYEIAEKYNLGVANLFHAGDGNLHPCFYFDDREPGIIDRVVEAGEAIMKRCLALGGSVSGEHGIGVEKLDLMSLMFSVESLALQGAAKSAFNDGMLCNPCKVLPNQKGCVEHMRRWRGAAW